jgi:hypothetical protein
VALRRALEVEAQARRELLAGVPEPAAFLEASALYRESYQLAPPASYGRLVGMLKTAVLGGSGALEASMVLGLLPDGGSSATAWYAIAIAALIHGDAERALRAAGEMRAGGDAFARAADAADAVARGDRAAAERAIAAIEDDFAGREAHLTGVPIADTAVLFTTLLERTTRLP